jgi:hypothetical protein
VEDYETGNEHRKHEPIIPDLKSRPHRHGGDHPTPFTKGCDDANKHKVPSAEGTAVGDQVKLKEEVLEEGDFEPAEAFTGARDGFAFKLGSKGLGYYRVR